MSAGEIAAARLGAGKFAPLRQPDGITRDIYYGNLEGFPLFVVVGIPSSAVSAELWRAVAPKAGLALLVLLGGSTLFWILLRQLSFAQAKEAEEALARLQAQRSEERFSRMFQFSPYAAMVTSFVGGRIISVNEAMLGILGRPRKDVVGRTTLDVGFWRSTEDRARALENLRFEKGGVQRFENTIRTPNREEKLIIVTTTRVELDGEEVLLSMIEDVTEKRQAERLLGESERRLAKIIDASPESITITSIDDGTFIEANPACERLYGYTRDELIGYSALAFGFWPDPEQRARFVAELREKEVVSARELRLRRKNGTLVDVLVTAALVEFEGRQLMLFQAVDITERKRAERLLGESEARLAKMIEASPEAITIGRIEDGSFVETNPACEQLTGYTREELIGRNSLELGFWPDPDERQRFMSEVRHDGIVNGRELRLRRKDGEVRHLLASAALIEIEGRKLMMFQAVDITDRKRAEARAQYLATQDPLTGLPNRVLLMDRLTHAITAARRLGGRIAVLFIDLDHFKTVNDSLGHHVGDQLLKEAAARIGRATRKDDTLARLGGDEFVLVAEGILSKPGAEALAKKILEALASPFDISGHAISISASIGIVAFPEDAGEAADLLRSADIAMYRAKDRGRNCHQFFSPEMNLRVVERRKLESRLRQALEQGALEVHYQPKVDIGSGRVMGAEALLRWHDAELGDVSPARFVAVAEETGLILNLGRWVIDRVARQIQDWHGHGLDLPVAVNLSVRQFSDELVGDVAASLKAAGLDPKWLEMEITESVFLRGVEDSERIVRQLSGLGVAITIDDFGTGYSSLSYLKRFSVHGIKVDRSFVHDIVVDSQDVAIVRAIVVMAHSLGVKVIAEGVETETQLAMLRDLGCDEYQGYLCSRAIAAPEFEKFVLAMH
jgi:diguanylate cyclase (GGDEF)-like protein/PAS domain S-box-containing protein